MFSHFSAIPQSGFSLLKPTPDRLSMVKKELISDHEMLRARNGESEFRREIPIPPTNENTRIRSPYSLSEMIREINGMNGESEVKKELISNHEMSGEMNVESEVSNEMSIPSNHENAKIISPSSIGEMVRAMNGESEVKKEFVSNHEMSREMNGESEVKEEFISNHEMSTEMNGEKEVKKEFISNHEMSTEMNGEKE